MSNAVTEVVETLRHLTAAEQREVLARLWTEQARKKAGEVWQTVRFSERLRVAAYASEQEKYIESLRDVLLNGTLARLESEEDGTFEIYGTDRTYYVTMTIAREFVGLLSSWSPEEPPREINLKGNE